MTKHLTRRSGLTWKTPRRSAQSNQCVAVAVDRDQLLLSDSKLGDQSPALVFTRQQWARFVQEIREDLPNTNGVVFVASFARSGVYPGGRVESTPWHFLGTQGVELHFTDGEWSAFRLGVLDGEYAWSAVVAALAVAA